MDKIVGLLQEAVFDESRWTNLASSIDSACGLTGTQLVVAPDANGSVPDFHFGRALIRGEPREDLELEYIERYRHRDERLPRMRAMSLGRLYHNTDLLTESEQKTSPVYAGFIPRFCSNDQLNVRVRGHRGTNIFWCLSRPMDGGGWSFENVERIGRLVPHVAHFVRVRQALAAADARGDALAALLDRTGLGVLHLDRGGRVLEANELARRVLAEGDCLTQRDGHLRASARHEDAELGRLLTACCERNIGGSMALWRLGDTHADPLVLHACPVPIDRGSFGAGGVAVQVLLTEPGSGRRVDPGPIAAAHGLTRTEAKVAALLAEGRTVSQIVASTGRKESTVRWHVRNLHSKLGVHRQTDLVRLVLASAVTAPTE